LTALCSKKTGKREAKRERIDLGHVGFAPGQHHLHLAVFVHPCLSTPCTSQPIRLRFVPEAKGESLRASEELNAIFAPLPAKKTKMAPPSRGCPCAPYSILSLVLELDPPPPPPPFCEAPPGVGMEHVGETW